MKKRHSEISRNIFNYQIFNQTMGEVQIKFCNSNLTRTTITTIIIKLTIIIINQLIIYNNKSTPF
jgi:hypothetical protein